MAMTGTFKLAVMNPDRMIFDGYVTSVFLSGEQGEFELLAYHYPVLSLLKRSEIVIDWKYSVPIMKGVAKFFKNDCVILVELDKEAYKRG